PTPRCRRGYEWATDPASRLAQPGAKGTGEATHARLFSGALAPMDGHAPRAPNLEVGFFAQHQVEEFDLSRSALLHLADLRPQDNNEQLRARLARFGFSGIKAETPTGKLSGGEKARLAFALATAHRPQLLILAEPTNHLDMASRERLVAAIGDFAGAVILVTHDWSLLELTCDRLWLVANGQVQPFEGDLEEYRAFSLAERRAQRGADEKPKTEAPAPRRAKPALGPLKKELAAAETELAKRTDEKTKLDAALADPNVYNDPAKAADLAKRHKDAVERVDAAEARWLAAAQALEEADAA
ncbi:MAG: ATP-binding cassette domain-containing protein, partial [Alphaproteobacteria bacterium]|nr:ATP-binding cassette domain-containing protein [Alphaproteobacteria bacterium]